MVKKITFWLLAIIVTLVTIVYQRVTGPTYPIRGKAYFDQLEIPYRLPRSHVTTSDCPVTLIVPDENVIGYVEYRPYRTKELWTRAPFKRDGDKITAYVPPLPAAGKLEYRVVLFDNDRDLEISIPQYGLVVMRFRGPVPGPVLILHVIVIFLGLLFSIRAGLEALSRSGRPQPLALLAFIFLFLGGLVLGPIVQKYAFGAWWTGFPVGRDLTDTKTLVALVFWGIAVVMGRKGRPARGWYLAASLLTLGVFFIPHSLLGSELRVTAYTPRY